MSQSNGTAHQGDGKAEAPPLSPSANGDGRDPKSGQFVKGWKGGPGNPTYRKLARNRTLLLEAITDDEIRQLGRKLWSFAMKGEFEAAKILLPYLVGKPRDAVEPDRADLDEFHLLIDGPTHGEVIRAGTLDVPVGRAIEGIHMAHDCLLPRETGEMLKNISSKAGTNTLSTQEAIDTKAARRRKMK